MSRAAQYRRVFLDSQDGKEVLADLASFVKQMPPAEAGSAGRMLAHIQQQLFAPTPEAPKPVPDRMRASGGRIAHG